MIILFLHLNLSTPRFEEPPSKQHWGACRGMGKVGDTLGPKSHLSGYTPRALEVSEASPLKSDCLLSIPRRTKLLSNCNPNSDQLSHPTTFDDRDSYFVPSSILRLGPRGKSHLVRRLIAFHDTA
jgi:hypothetical protein